MLPPDISDAGIDVLGWAITRQMRRLEVLMQLIGQPSRR